jgi:hypothetical protein
MAFQKAEIPLAQRPWDIPNYLEVVLTEPAWFVYWLVSSVTNTQLSGSLKNAFPVSEASIHNSPPTSN